MPLEIKINDNKLNHLTGEAKIILEEQLNIYTQKVIDEASLIEETLRETGANKEITSNHILQAVRKGKISVSTKKPGYIKLCKCVSPIAILFTGLLFDSNNEFKGVAWQLYAFILALIVAVATTIVQYMKEGD